MINGTCWQTEKSYATQGGLVRGTEGTVMQTQPGWPPDAAHGEFIGWDAQGVMCVLRWAARGVTNEEQLVGSWVGVRFDPQTVPNNVSGRHLPMYFMRGHDTEQFVCKHAKAE